MASFNDNYGLENEEEQHLLGSPVDPVEEATSFSSESEAQSYQSPEGSDIEATTNTLHIELPDEDSEVVRQTFGFVDSPFWVFVYRIGVILTGGMLALLCRWMPQWWVKITQKRVHLNKAHRLVVPELDGSVSVLRVRIYRTEELDCKGTPFDGKHQIRLVEHKYVRYVYHPYRDQFLPAEAFEKKLTKRAMVNKALKEESVKLRALSFVVHGHNETVVDVPSYGHLLVTEVLHPFYIFQIASIVLWVVEEYYYYAVVIFVTSVISIVVSLLETRRNLESLRNMASFTTAVGVVRDGEYFEIPDSSDLVPGDLIYLPAQGMVMPCDAVLLSGKCIVNEAMLTGESVPVAKESLTPADHYYDPDEDKRHTLFAGTQIIQTRYYGTKPVVARVVRTGFTTAKGSLVRSILFPRPSKFKFYEDAFKFIGCLAILSLIGFGYTIVMMFHWGTCVYDAIIRALDLITIVVPPALPTAMTVGTVFAMERMKEKDLYCISPPRVNVCGKLKMICFDKTGTLTEEGLDVWGAVPSRDACFEHAAHDFPAELSGDLMMVCMASCHSLTRVHGELVGDPVDLKMFEATGWVLDESSGTPPERRDSNEYINEDGATPRMGEESTNFDRLAPTVVRAPEAKGFDAEAFLQNEDAPSGLDVAAIGQEYGIVTSFPFSARLQRMSVITKGVLEDDYTLFVKGSPEMIRDLSSPDSIPPDFAEILKIYTSQGLRVLALAYKELPDMSFVRANRIEREDVEYNLIFLGFLIMQNRLKPQSQPAVEELISSGVRIAMVTGDNALTATSVARECGMIGTEAPVWLGDLSSELDADGRPFINWTHMDEPDIRMEDSHRSSMDNQSLENAYHHDMDGNVSLDRLLRRPDVEIAITGRAFGLLVARQPMLFDRLLVRGVIFARMSPDQKAELVTRLMDLGYCVAFCGDGANDCGALKAAHVGVSLSDSEASVAAPFTCKVPTIECMLTVIKEGRAALITSFGCFQYMALYSMIQFVSILILYYIDSNLGDFQFLYFDLVLILPVAMLMGWTRAYEEIIPLRPPGSLIAPVVIISLILHILLVVLFQVMAYVWLQKQPWYRPLQPDPAADNIESQENYVIFFISCFQYLHTAIAFSLSKQYRQPIYNNRPYLFTLILLYVISFALVLIPVGWIDSLFQFDRTDIPTSGYVFLSLLVVANGLMHFLLEKYCVQAHKIKRLIRRIGLKRGFKNRYKYLRLDSLSGSETA
eukprot:Clim_evm57s22 gene=Clim_evmTU57s22